MPADHDDPEVGAEPTGTAGDQDSPPSVEPTPELPSVAQLTLDLEQTRAAYQRLAADFENYKRRKTQETQDLARYGSAALLQAILPALDNLARAVAHIDAEASDGVSEGLRLTVRQLEEALASQGVQRIAAVGQPFDPRLHEAVATVPAEGVARDIVVTELLPGYQVHDRVVRPAQVTVAQPDLPASPPASGAGVDSGAQAERMASTDPETSA